MTAACPGCMAAPQPIDIPPPPNAVQLSVPAIRCAACIAAIEDHLTALKGVTAARVNLSRKRVEIQTDLPVAELTQALCAIGYEAFPLDAAALGSESDTAGRDLLMRLGVAGFAMMNVMLLSVAVWSGAGGATRDLFHLISAAIALPVMLYSAQPFFHNALGALRVGRLNMDVPISLAILLAGAMSLFETLYGGEHAYFDAALSLTFFLLIGRYLEHRTRAAARSTARELAALEVHTADRKIGDQVETVPIDALRVDDVVVVPTGLRVPVDGHLTSPLAHTDRSFLTGESDPVSHSVDAFLNAGEINLGAPFEMRAKAVGDDTRLQQIARLVETAENARNRYTSLADRAARIYAPAVHLLAFGTFLGWLLIGQDVRQALNVAIAVLIITCPCALGLAVPAVSTAAISRLYQLGFLIKSGTALERLADVDHVVFDKTGTLTKPGFSFDLGRLSAAEQGIAKALASSSAHPLSKALSHYLGDMPPAEIGEVQEKSGSGVTAMHRGAVVALGRAEWLGGQGGGLMLRVGDKMHHLPYVDAPMDGLPDMVEGLEQHALALEIISGDTPEKTGQLARRCGIGQYAAGLSPEAKQDHMAMLTQSGRVPGMVGDGLNDTAALATAHASIAPGTALDAARSAADVVMIGNKLGDLPKLFTISKRAVRLSKQNFGIAIAYNAVAIPIAIMGYATPLSAALAMSLSSITVLLNAIRVGRVR